MTGRSVFWISGWTIPAHTLAGMATKAMPGWRHDAVDAGPDAAARAIASPADFLGGFSFGAHLLLGIDDPRPRILLAPFVDLKSEAGLGGAVATVQIRQQLRQLRRDPASAVADFRRRIGAAPPAAEDGPFDVERLAWGLERMLENSGAPAPLPEGSIAVAGNADPLLDAAKLAGILTSLRIVDAGHQPEPLLAATAALLQDVG
ncbi:MAG: hypothetical protein FGM15_09675 [Chthoniobacterales bacterium]|nr:hypothetical protein [Chthoniobacterales bacterium]